MKRTLALSCILPLLAACAATRPEASARPRLDGANALLAPAILNVYATAALADAAAVNAADMCARGTGAPSTRAVAVGAARLTLSYDPGKPALRVLMEEDERPSRRLELRPVLEGLVGLDATGHIIVYARRMGERVVVSDSEANVLRVYEPGELERLASPSRGLAGR